MLKPLNMNKRATAWRLLMLISFCLFSGTATTNEEASVNQHRQIQADDNPYAVHDAQLRETMMQLNALVSYAEQPTAPLDEDSKGFLLELLNTVEIVARSAESLKQAKKLEHLSDDQYVGFKALADHLYSEAIHIDLNAKLMNIEQMNEAFLNLNQTCISCHKLFRSL